MPYMSARTSFFLGCENLDTTIAIVCLEMPCIVGWMASFSMTRSFAAKEFWTDYVCSKMFSGGGLLCRGQSVRLHWGLVDCFMYGMGFYWEFFLNRLLNCYYLHLLKLSLVSWRYLWTITFEEFTISIIIIMNIIIVITIIIIIIIIIIDIIISLLLLPSHHYYY